MNKHRLVGLLTVLVILVAACGGPAPTPTPTPAPTNTPAPTSTPIPTIDVASLPAADVEATVVALEAALEELHAGAAAAGEAAEGDITSRAMYLEKDLEAARAALEAALAREGGAGEAAAPALTLAGDFAEAKDWGWADLEALDMITATVAGPKDDDPEAEYTGVSLAALMEAAGLGADATTLVATAADGFEAEIDVAALKDCAECMLVLEDGSLRLVMPGFASKAWVRDLVSLEAK